MTMYDQRQFEPSRVTSQSHICGCCAKLQAFLVAVWRNSGTNAMKTLHISTSVGVARFQPSTDVTTRHPIGHSSPSISLQLVSSWLAMILAKEGPMTEVTEKRTNLILSRHFPSWNDKILGVHSLHFQTQISYPVGWSIISYSIPSAYPIWITLCPSATT